MNWAHFHTPPLCFQRSGSLRRWAALCFLMAGLLAFAGQSSAQTMKVGNLIFVDANGNGHYDPGEGAGGVAVELWKTNGDTNNLELAATTTTASNGFYVFENLPAGYYHVTVPASEFAPGKPLEGMITLPNVLGFGMGDDDTGQKGQGSFAPTVIGFSTLDFVVAPGFGPVGTDESGFMGNYDDADDANGDMTIDFGFYRPLGVGNLVFVDTNGNGKADPGEGIAGVDVQLYREGDTPLVDPSVSDLVTDDSGHFLFGGLLPGAYKLYIPPSQFQQGGPLEGALSVPGVGGPGEDDDVGEDGIDDPHPELNGILSRTFTLATGMEPTALTGETGSNASDDDATDSDVDLTIDLGFVLPSGKVGVGNLVFIDSNNNGHYDDGEGAAGVTVQLFAAGQDPLSATPVASIQTAGDGSYLITNLDPGSYFLFVPPSEFAPGKPLFSALSVPGVQEGDDQAGEDGQDVPYPEISGVRTGDFSLAVGTAPTDADTELGYLASSDNFHDADVDLTRDFGFQLRAHNPMSVGNLVFVDANHNGHFDSGEGVGGVLVQLFREGDDPATATPVASQLTETDGNYFFSGLVPGRYFVQVAASSFALGQPLHGLLSIPGNGGDDHVDDDADENGIDSPNPDVTGIRSVVITLAEGTEPVETGFRSNEDDALDTNGDMTIDFGFVGACPTMSIVPGTLANGSVGTAYGTTNFVVAGTTAVVAWNLSAGVLPPGLALSPTGGLSGTPTQAGTYGFTIRAATGDACETTTVYSVTIAPPAGNLGVGNAIYFDANGNGVMDSGEGVAGVLIQLFHEGDDPLTATPLASMNTSAQGLYLFGGLVPGRYFVQVPASEFAVGKPLQDRVSAPGVSGDDGVDDNVPGNDNGIDAADPTVTGISSIVFELAPGTEPVDGPGGTETGINAESDNAADANVDLTIDLAFVRSPQASVGVGNVVFKDANGNGHYDAGEGVDGVTVQLYASGADPQTDTPLEVTVTSLGGRYSFNGLVAGDYFIHVPAADFAVSGTLSGLLSVPGVGTGDDDVDEDGIDAPAPAVTGISSRIFTLALGAAPTDAGIEHGVGATDDNAYDANFDATIDLGFYDPAQPVIGVGNLVFIDANGNGHYDAGEGVAGVTVQLFAAGADPLSTPPLDVAVTDAQGTYLLTTNLAGDYMVFIPPSEFSSGRPLNGYLSMTGNGSNDGVDDDTDENGIDSAHPELTGIRTTAIHLEAGTEPTDATGETGFLASSDNANDANFDLTVDFGFALACPPFVITPGSLPDGTQGVAYTASFGATGGTGPYAWAVTTGALPAGVTLAGTGNLAGAPTADGTFSFTITATDSKGCKGAASYQIMIGTLPTVGLGNAIYVDANHNGIMDSGEGAAGVRVQLFNAGDDPQTATALQETLTSLQGEYSFLGLAPGSYFVQVPASEFAIGKPLAGLISIPGVSGDNGVDDNVAGNDKGIDAAHPELTGVSSIVVLLQPGAEPVDGPAGTETGFDAAGDNGADASINFTIDLGFQTPCPTLVITPGGLPPVTVGFPYAQTLIASGGTGPVVFSVTGGGLPAGFTLSTAGLLSGMTSTQGVFPVTIRATNVDGCFVELAASLAVNGPLAVGNLVFFDKNGNGRADAGEGVDGVTVELYHSADTPGTDTPMATATTSNGGFYLIDTLPPGQYVLHVPKAMFASGAPLWKMLSVPGVGTGDDDAGEAGQDAIDPTVTGVSTQVFTLAAGAAPTAATGETGLGSASDDTRDADVDLTKDFGFVDVGAQPATFSDWATSKGLSPGDAGPTANPDHDAYSNLMEYALGLDPTVGGGDPSGAFAVSHNAGNGKMDVQLRRRHGGQGDLTYTLQVLPALNSGAWVAASVVPTVVNNGDGTETVTYGSLDDDPALAGSNSGLVRVLVVLDANHDGIPDATDTSPIMGWQRRTLAVQNQTYSVPFVPAPVFTGVPDAVNGNVLDVTTSTGSTSFAGLLTPGREYYVEVMGGVNVGQRWEIDEASSTATAIVLLPGDGRSTLASVPVSLEGDLIAVRPHWRVVDLFPPADYHATGLSSTADQILMWDTAASGYVTLWLANYGGQAHWHQVGVASLTVT